MAWPTAALSGDGWPPYFVGEVVVVEDAEDGDLGPGTVSVLDAEAIRRLGARTVAEAIQHLAGASMSVGSRNEQRVWVRGYEPADVLVLLDGIPIADPYSGEVDLGQIPVGDVARIVLTQGAASPAYGPGGMGGVINIVTVRGAGSPGGSADLRITDSSTLLAHGAVGGASGRVDFYVGAGYESSDGWRLSSDFEPTPYEDGGRRDNSDFERSSALVRLGFGVGEAGRLTTTFRLLDSDRGIPFSTERPAGFVRFARFPVWRQGTAAVGWESGSGDTTTVRAQLYGHRFDNTLDVYGDQELDEQVLESTFADDVVGGWVVADRAVGRHALTASLHLAETRHERLEAEPGRPLGPTEQYRVRSGSAALQDRVTFGPGAALTVSVAADHYGVERSWRADSGVGDTGSSTSLAPQAELDLVLGRGVWGSVAAYRRTRFPTLRQMYGADVPNPDLEPQHATGLTLGLSWRPDERSRLDASLYADRVDDIITRLGRPYPYENQDRAELAGLEVSARRAWSRVDVGVEATLQRAELVESSQGLEEIPFVPSATLDADLGVRVAASGDLRLHWAWVGTRVWYDGPSREELGPYQLLRVAVGWRWRVVDLELAVDNALDADVEQEWGYPLAGRRLWASLRGRF